MRGGGDETRGRSAPEERGICVAPPRGAAASRRTWTTVSDPSFSLNVTVMVSASASAAPWPWPCPRAGADARAKPRSNDAPNPAERRDAPLPSPGTAAREARDAAASASLAVAEAAPGATAHRAAIARATDRAPDRNMSVGAPERKCAAEAARRRRCRKRATMAGACVSLISAGPPGPAGAVLNCGRDEVSGSETGIASQLRRRSGREVAFAPSRARR